LNTYKMTAKELATKMIHDVYYTTGITATAGIGTNLYLCKIAMDIVAKHCEADKNGVRIAELDEMGYRKQLWGHRPITDFWRVGKGYATRLAKHGIYTMGDVARTSVKNEELLYKLFGINAELLIDHAWGWEPCTMKEIKAYKPQTNSLSSGQVLHCPYDFEKTRLIVKEMTELLSLDLVRKGLVTSQLVLTIGYDVENLTNSNISKTYNGEVTIDRYGRNIPKHAHGTVNIDHKTASTKIIMDAVMELFDRIINKNLLVRRINICANNVITDEENKKQNTYEQMDLFSNFDDLGKKKEENKKHEESEKQIQKAMLKIKEKYGKNAIIKGMNLQEGGTTIDRNKQVGGHKA
ncbi:DNA methylase, partial [bacterium]|nr:DNA methylase [bacterium]